MLLLRDAEADQQFGRIGLHGVAAGVGEKTLDIVGAVLFLRSQVDLAVKIFALLVNLPELLVAHIDDVEDRDVLVVVMVLLQKAHAAILVDRNRAGGRLLLAGEDLHEGRFAGAVRADQAVTAARREFHRDVFEKRLLAEAAIIWCDSSSYLFSIKNIHPINIALPPTIFQLPAKN